MAKIDKQLISISDAATITGMSPNWWREAIAGRKPMPPVRVRRLGGAIRIHLGDLLQWIDGGVIPTTPRRGRGRPKKTKPMT